MVVHPNKSAKEKIPNIEEKYYSSFILGLFDGDGSFSYWYTKKNKLQSCFNIVSSKEVLEFVSKEIFITHGIKTSIKPDGRIYRIDIGGNLQTILIMDWLYENCPERLIRKRNKYLEFKDLLQDIV